MPSAGDPAWDAKETWHRAELLVAHVDLIGERAWPESIPLALSKASLGDPGELMRGLRHGFERSVRGDWPRLVGIYLRALASTSPAARRWAAENLGPLDALTAAPLLLAAVRDPVLEVAEAACDASLRLAAEHQSIRAALREALSDVIATDAPAAARAIKAMARLDDHERAEATEQRALAAAIALRPIAAIRSVRRCGIGFRFRCPRAWEALEKTDDPDIRHCHACSEQVHLCRSDEETLSHAMAGHCIAREEPDGSEMPAMVVGRPARPPEVSSRQEHARRWRRRERGIAEAIATPPTATTRRCPECSYPVPDWRVSCYVCGHELGRA